MNAADGQPGLFDQPERVTVAGRDRSPLGEPGSSEAPVTEPTATPPDPARERTAATDERVATRAEAMDQDVGGSTGWFLPTNRHNLLKMLAVRAVLPFEAFADKYYDDLLRLCPGRLPLLRGGMPTSLLPQIAVEEFDIPVLLEISVEALASRPDEGSTVWAPPGPLPLRWLKAIHFRSELDREEFLRNEYADVRPVPNLCAVSPALFTVEGDAGTTAAFLSAAVRPEREPDFVAADRRTGAALTALLVADAAVSTLITGSLGGRRTGGAQSLQGLATWLAGGTSETAAAAGPEALVAYRTLAELGAVDRRREWRPSALVKRLQAALPVGLDEADSRIVAASLDRAAAFLRSDEEFSGFKEGGWAALKALLLVLMRPDYDRMNIADSDVPGLDAEAKVLAASFLGCLTGRSRLPVAARPLLLDDALAYWECAVLQPDASVIASAPDFAVEDDPAGAWITMDGTRIQPLASAPAPLAAVSVARDYGWTDLLITTVHAQQADTDLQVRPAGGAAALTLTVRGDVVIAVEVDREGFVERVLAVEDAAPILARLQPIRDSDKKPRPRRAKGSKP